MESQSLVNKVAAVRDDTGQHFCGPARQELTRNHLARPVYAKLQLIFWPGPDRPVACNRK